MTNLLALLGFIVIAVCVAGLFGPLWAGLTVVGPVLLLAAYVAHLRPPAPAVPSTEAG